MQNLAKRQWRSSLTIKESADMMIDWCVRAREKNVLRKRPPQIFYAYVIEDNPPLQYLHNISSVFKYSQKDVPYVDTSRDSLLRCLSVALKTHFFMFQEERVAHEPYFFVIPSLYEPTQTTFGIVYTLEKINKNIIVCEQPLKNLSDISKDNNKEIIEFPAVVIEDSYKWYHMKNWAKIKQNSSTVDNKKQSLLIKESSTREELEQHAVIIDVPYEIKDDIKPLGIEWSNKVKAWYLPKGFEVESVLELIEYKKKQHIKEEKNKN